MKERPILFNGEMVRALIKGSKTQTRRIMKPQPVRIGNSTILQYRGGMYQPEKLPLNSNLFDLCPYGNKGDRLWVRETFMDLQGTGVEHRDSTGKMQRYAYAAEFPPESYGDSARKDYGLKWKPSIHMPRAASRILLEIVSVRVERLNDCSVEDALAEGITHRTMNDPRVEYQHLWESINGAGSWAENPWCWAITFRRIEP